MPRIELFLCGKIEFWQNIASNSLKFKFLYLPSKYLSGNLWCISIYFGMTFGPLENLITRQKIHKVSENIFLEYNNCFCVSLLRITFIIVLNFDFSILQPRK